MVETNNGKTNWGGLTKTMIAGGAIAAGVALVFPDIAKDVYAVVQSIGGQFAESAAKLGTEKGVEEVTKSSFGKTIQFLAEKVGGIVLAVTGYKYLTSEDKGKHAAPAGGLKEEVDSFRLIEDMKANDALMQARMVANGHQPAMAMANGRGR